MITHMVVFNLRSELDAKTEKVFFAAVRTLGRIEGVQDLQCLNQISPKCQFKHGITMQFEDDAAYKRYCVHPAHVRFVEERWKKGVEDFMEIDLTPSP